MEHGLMQLAQDLEWLSRRLRPMPDGDRSETLHGPAEELLPENQRSIIATADKIARELLSTIRFDPTRLVGVGCPIEDTIDSMADLIAALEEIKQDAVAAPAELPVRVRAFNQMIAEYLDGSLPTAA